MTQRKILEKGNFVVYKDYKNEKTIIEDLRTGEVYTIDYYPEYYEGPPKLGDRYVVFEKGYIYDLQEKELITKPVRAFDKYFPNYRINACLCMVSDDFLNGKIPFYYAHLYEYILADHQKGIFTFRLCAIFNRDEIIGYVKRNSYTILMPTTNSSYWESYILKNHYKSNPEYKALYEAYNCLITEKTQYISEVENEKGLISFYKLTKDGLELVSELQLDEQYFYETHFASCGNKFVIFERDFEETNTTRRILVYNVSTGGIEYENYVNIRIVFPHPDEDLWNQKVYNKMIFEFLTNLLLYVHDFQDSYFHIILKPSNKIVDDVILMPIEQWRLKKALNEVLKGFFPSKEPHTSHSLRI